MPTLTFPDPETEQRALGCLAGRFSCRAISPDAYEAPEEALEALAAAGIPFDLIPELTAEMKAELARRIAEADANPDNVLSWEEMQATLNRYS